MIAGFLLIIVLNRGQAGEKHEIRNMLVPRHLILMIPILNPFYRGRTTNS
jgi:hypothetical protein